jgi:hypothetical protein
MIPITQATNIPSQPKRVIKITITPAKVMGAIKKLKKVADFIYMALKSLEIRLMILPNYCVFAVYCVILDSFAYIKKIN